MLKEKLMLRRIYIHVLSLFFVPAFCMPFLSSCGETVGETAPGLVTLKVTLPQDESVDMDSPASRTGTPVSGETAESEITALKFFIFNQAGTTLEVYKSITIAADGTSTDPMWDPVNRTLRITVTPGAKKIYCLANWTDNSADGMPAIDGNIATIAALTARTRNHGATYPALANPPVMTGELATTIQGSETNLSISLTRQVARVELAFRLSDVLTATGTAKVVVTGVRFLKLPSASFVFPQPSVASPSGVTPWSQTGFTGTTTGDLTDDTEFDYATKYYIPENAPLEANATEMVISATYNGTSTYYRIPIDPSQSSGYPHTAFVIERNHTYRYTITVEGAGEPTEPTRGTPSGNANVSYQLEIK